MFTAVSIPSFTRRQMVTSETPSSRATAFAARSPLVGVLLGILGSLEKAVAVELRRLEFAAMFSAEKAFAFGISATNQKFMGAMHPWLLS